MAGKPEYKKISDELLRLGLDKDLCAEFESLEIHQSRTAFEVPAVAPAIQLHLARQIKKLISKK